MMATDAIAYRRAAYPLLPGMHAFHLSYDNSKSRKVDMDKLAQQEAEGVKFVNGRISLDNGSTYETQGEMETLLGLAGKYSIDWQD